MYLIFSVLTSFVRITCSIVTYASAQDAVRAVSRLNGLEYNGRVLHARLDKTRYEKLKTKGVSVFLGNLTWTITDSELQDLCAPHNPLHCSIMTNINGRSRGFAIVLFQTQEEAELFASQMQGRELEGRTVLCRIGFNGDCALDKISTVFVGKLDPSVQEEDLHDLFSKCGAVQAVSVKRNGEGKPKGWG